MSEEYEPDLVSVIIPTYNRAKHLIEAMDSVQNQTYRPIELIVVDDGSTDCTKMSVEVYAAGLAREQGLELQYIPRSNQGPEAARNQGLRVARGKYVRFLDSDDWLLPQATAVQMDVLKKSEADVCYGSWLEMCDGFPGTRERQGVFTAELNPDPVAALLGDQWCPNFCYLILCEWALKVGGWTEHYGPLEDRDFINRIALNGAMFVGTSSQIGCYRQHPGPRLSREDRERWMQNMKRVIFDGIEWLNVNSEWTEARREAVANSLFLHARRFHGVDRSQFRECIQTLREFSPHFRPHGSIYPLAVWALGYECAESLRQFCRRLLRRI